MFHAHEKFGVKVTGVNSTTSQVDMVRAEIARRRNTLAVVERVFR
jgi:cyclopropane fatty-acyl-phospholipid synthase-like methyltransferase